MDRFFIPGVSHGGTVPVDDAEARHMTRVLRMKPGDMLVAFDGTGVECVCRLAHSGRRLAVQVVERRQVSREAAVQVTLAIAAAKTKAMDVVLQKCTELGLARLVPFHSQRSVAKVDDAKLEKWRRITIEAAKQCGRNVLPELMHPLDTVRLAELIREHDVAVVAALDPSAKPLKQVLQRAPAARRILYVIGPEGGFGPGELEPITAAGAAAVSLGRSVLRVETAAVAALAMILYHYSDAIQKERSEQC